MSILQVTQSEHIFCLMVCRSPMRLVVLGCAFALLFAQVIRAQSPQARSQPCQPSCLSSDDLRELVGQKVYPKVIIDDLKFEGPTRLPDSSKEQELIAELKHHVFDADSDWLDEIMEAPIRGAWQDLGYLKVEVSGQSQVVSADSTFEHVLLTVRVKEGLQYTLGDVHFRQADPHEPLKFPSAELRRLILLQAGDLFAAVKIRESLTALAELYHSHGYLDFVSTPMIEADDSTRRISLTIELDEGPQFRVAKIEVFGLKPSKALMLTNSVKPGDVFNRSLVDEFIIENMSALPAGASPHVLGIMRDPKKRTVDVVVDFRPRPQQMEF